MVEDLIAFTRLQGGDRGRICLVDPGSGEVWPLTGSDFDLHDPAWSPDGSRLVAIGRGPSDGYMPQLYLIDAGTGKAERLTDDGAPKLRPAWSPDGSTVIFELSVGRMGYHLYAIRPDGGSLRQITGPPRVGALPQAPPAGTESVTWVEPDTDPSPPSEEGQPAWSPDGTTIAFVRGARSPRRHHDDSGHVTHIWTVLAAGTGELRLSRGLVHDHDPSYSPDGARIVFTRWRDAEMIRGHSAVGVYVMSADGADVHVLIEEPAHYATPNWSPDGTRVVCSRSLGGPSHLFLFQADGSGGRALTDPEEDGDYHPTCRP